MVNITIPKYPVIIPLRSGNTPATISNNDHQGAVSIETNDYVVRSLSPNDVTEQFLSWFNEPNMLSGLNLENLNFTIERLRSFIATFDNHRNYFLGIFYNDEIVGFYTIDVNLVHRTGSITTGIGNNKFLGKNTLRLTIDAVLDYFYAHRNIEKFTARILSKNYAMLFNFRDNMRFFLEAHLKRECRAPDGRRLDLLIFASHKDELSSMHSNERQTTT